MTDQMTNFVAPQTVELVGDESRHTKAQLIEALIMQTVLVANVDEEVQRMQKDIDALNADNDKLRDRLAAVSASRGELLLAHQNTAWAHNNLEQSIKVVDELHEMEIAKFKKRNKKLRNRLVELDDIVARVRGVGAGWAEADDHILNRAAMTLSEVLKDEYAKPY